MGKYERGWASKVEEQVAFYLKGEAHGDKSFGVGDVTVDDTKIEIKSSSSGHRIGTLANIGQNALTLYELFNNGLSWKDYRDKSGFADFRVNIFKKNYPGYKTESDFLKNHYFICEEDKAILKEQSLINKKHYTNYLKSLEQNKEQIKVFYLNMINGRHNSKTYTKNIFMDQKYKTIAVDKNGEIKKEIVYFFDNSYIYYIDFVENSTDLLLKAVSPSGDVKKLLRIVFHWKNKGQGIQTPCLNIFYVGI